MIPKKEKLEPGDLVGIAPGRTVYSSVEIQNGNSFTFFNISPSHYLLYISSFVTKRGEEIDVVMWRGKTLHVASGVLERIQ